MRNFTSRTSFVPRRNRNGATTYGTATQYGISHPNGVQATSSSDSSSLLTEIDGLRDSLKDKVSKSELIQWNRSPYTADHAAENDYQKVLTIDYDSSLWLNAVSMCFGNKADNQIWLNTLGDVTLTMIFGWDFVVARNGDKTTLYVKTFKYDTPAVPSYTFQIVQYTGSEIVWHDNAFETLSKATAARTIYQPQPPKKEDSVVFDIQNSAARLQMDNSINFIGDVKDSSSTAVLTVSGNEVSKMYQFTFTKTINGLTIKSVGGVQYCSISETILQGDVVTFTVVSNSINGWIYSKQGAAIQSSDGSVKVNWIDGIADLSVSGGGGSDDCQLKSNMLTERTQINSAAADQYPSAVAIRDWVNYINLAVNFRYENNAWVGMTKSISAMKGYDDPLLTRTAIVQYVDAKLSKKIYYVPKDTPWNIPSDADVVILRRSNFSDDLSEMEDDHITILLPDNVAVGKHIDVVFTNINRQTQQIFGLHVKASRGLNSQGNGYLIRLYQGQTRSFVYYGGEQDDYDGGWGRL